MPDYEIIKPLGRCEGRSIWSADLRQGKGASRPALYVLTPDSFHFATFDLPRDRRDALDRLRDGDDPYDVLGEGAVAISRNRIIRVERAADEGGLSIQVLKGDTRRWQFVACPDDLGDVLFRALRQRPGRGSAEGERLAALILGAVALVLGVPAVAITWSASLRVVGVVCGGLGLVVSGVGTGLALRPKGSGLGLPLAGGVVNFVALVVALIMVLVPSTPAPEKKAAAAPLGDWGEAVDPDHDCTITREGAALVISVPGTAHDLSAELGQVNAPRVLREVEGDFTARVKVCGTVRPEAAGTVEGRLAYQAGGLLLWGDERNFIRLERAALNRNGAVLSMGAFEARADGLPNGAQSEALPEQDTYLRLERRGNQVFGWVSRDGREWTALHPFTVTLPAKVRVGVTAVNAAAQPLAVRFEEFQLGR